MHIKSSYEGIYLGFKPRSAVTYQQQALATKMKHPGESYSAHSVAEEFCSYEPAAEATLKFETSEFRVMENI